MKKGSISIDFILSFTVMCILILYFLMVSLTLTYIEISQYITFQTSRVFSIGHKDENTHRDKATEIHNHLVGRFQLSSTGGDPSEKWFLLHRLSLGLSDKEEFFRDVGPDLFFGAESQFISRAMGLGIPFLGDTLDQAGTDDGKFIVNLGSYLGREPSRAECINFQTEITTKIRELTGTASYVWQNPTPMENLGNGC